MNENTNHYRISKNCGEYFERRVKSRISEENLPLIEIIAKDFDKNLCINV